ncbi:Hypothetical Protein FCC1311_023062 [Hondaea fermentalgiana]|uniref:Uncharacterized protein n=1 Tax=Hondaea fermentalgiana TaxID=2315210 RepID=A0A2R5G4Y7_9STRA|nr:Hypothetical Protein FCC1311_023062 [Hondaea fermentalgiana]|eukprot:GBG26086.1 Hypothetical Protein FCC1311_023062 [Hondaea fermentalgiana]
MAALNANVIEPAASDDSRSLESRFMHLKSRKRQFLSKRLIRSRNRQTADDTVLLDLRRASSSVPEDESMTGGSPHGLIGGGFSAGMSVDSREYPTGFRRNSIDSPKQASSSATMNAGKRKKRGAMRVIKDKMMTRKQRVGRGPQSSRRRGSKLSGSNLAGDPYGHDSDEVTQHSDEDDGADEDYHDEEQGPYSTGIAIDKDSSDNRYGTSQHRIFGTTLRPRQSSGLRAANATNDDDVSLDDDDAKIFGDDAMTGRTGFLSAIPMRKARARRTQGSQQPHESPLQDYPTGDESSEYSKAMHESDFEQLEQGSAASNTVLGRDKARRRRSSLGPLQALGGRLAAGAANSHATDRNSEDAASDDGLGSIARSGPRELSEYESPDSRSMTPHEQSQHASKRSPARLRASAPSSEKRWIGEVRQKLIEWEIPQTAWKLPPTGHRAGAGSALAHNGLGDALYNDGEPPDPHTNERRVRQLVEENERLRELVSKRKLELERVHNSTRSKVDDLQVAIRNFERKLAFYDKNVNQKHAQINEHFTRFKSEMTDDIREKVRKQLESREEDYYSLIERVQKNIKYISENNRQGNGLVDGLVNALMHRSFSLVLSGAGTIAHVISMLVGVVLAPFFFVLGFFKNKEPPRTEESLPQRQLHRDLRSRSSSQSSDTSKLSTRGGMG